MKGKLKACCSTCTVVSPAIRRDVASIGQFYCGNVHLPSLHNRPQTHGAASPTDVTAVSARAPPGPSTEVWQLLLSQFGKVSVVASCFEISAINDSAEISDRQRDCRHALESWRRSSKRSQERRGIPYPTRRSSSHRSCGFGRPTYQRLSRGRRDRLAGRRSSLVPAAKTPTRGRAVRAGQQRPGRPHCRPESRCRPSKSAASNRAVVRGSVPRSSFSTTPLDLLDGITCMDVICFCKRLVFKALREVA